MARKATVVNPPESRGTEPPATANENAAEARSIQPKRKAPVSQSDVPSYTLDEALRIAHAIRDHYALKDTTPLDIARALQVQPSSGPFRMLCGASVAYGLTEGGYSAPKISVTRLARRILEPLEEGDDLNAQREAIQRPRVINEFLTRYNNAKLPREDIAINVLVEIGVPRDSAKRTLDLILSSAERAGFITTINKVRYISMTGSSTGNSRDKGDTYTEDDIRQEGLVKDDNDNVTEFPYHPTLSQQRTDNRKVFITHGKNKAFIDPLKDLLTFGELQPVVAVERESVSQPVPDKVMSDMRECSAAIIHVEADQRLIDGDRNTHIVLNPNVLIEIGAAMALYGRRFILLVRSGIQPPSNLQGLYEVRYDGEKLDGDATIKLLKAIKDIKNHPLPGQEK